MRCQTIQFRGFKRLADTKCDVGPRLLAFVGQNEAGKSSVLQGLTWLTEDDETPLAELDKSRTKKVSGGWVVGAWFELDPTEVDAIRDFGFATTPTHLTMWKQADGSVVFDLHPTPLRDPAPFTKAKDSITRFADGHSKQLEGTFDEKNDPNAWITTIATVLDEPETIWEAGQIEAVRRLAEWFGGAGTGSRVRSLSTAKALSQVLEIVSREHPKPRAIAELEGSVPKFVLFKDQDRALQTTSPIGSGDLSELSPSLRNLLKFAGVSTMALVQAERTGDSGEIETILLRGNAALETFFTQSWNQSNVTVRVGFKDSVLSTHIHEIENNRVTRIEERSDGLRAFLALAAFLEAQDLEVPPILLIDEAENHLHFDAQADLVGVLLKQVKASQVIYTTHSPGCLPSDLGTGIRVVERHSEESELKSHFWANQAPGFGPLLLPWAPELRPSQRAGWQSSRRVRQT